MTFLLASVPLKIKEIAPVDFVPIAVLLFLLVEREAIRARPGAQRPVAQHVLDFAIFPLVSLFLIFVGLRAFSMIG
jgi:hypothetical protein